MNHKPRKQVHEFNGELVYQRTFRTIEEAAAHLGKSYGVIYAYVREKRPINGNYYSFEKQMQLNLRAF